MQPCLAAQSLQTNLLPNDPTATFHAISTSGRTVQVLDFSSVKSFILAVSLSPGDHGVRQHMGGREVVEVKLKEFITTHGKLMGQLLANGDAPKRRELRVGQS